MRDLGTLGGATSTAFAINNQNQVVGYSDTIYRDVLHAFKYSNGFMQDIGTLNGINESEAEAINDSGQIVGTSYNFGVPPHAFLYSNGLMQDLNTLTLNLASGWTLEDARGINNAGQIAGYGVAPSGQLHAFLLNPVPPALPNITLPPLSQGVQSGQKVTFSVVATSSSPLSYQWRFTSTDGFGRQSTWQDIPGEIGATLTKSFVTAADAGAYSVVLRNAAGLVTSATATLIVSSHARIPLAGLSKPQSVEHALLGRLQHCFSRTEKIRCVHFYRKNGRCRRVYTG